MRRNLFGKALSHGLGSFVPSSQTMTFNLIVNISGDTIVILVLQIGTPPQLISKEMDKPRL